MAAKDEDVKSQELNFIIAVLGERGQETQRWKEYYRNYNFKNKIFHNLWEFIPPEDRLIVQMCGSKAENLNCQENNYAGDLDIMIIPYSDRLMIHDELIEYLPENPLHVRIKGANHPVLQSCLVEGTEYVATLALKRFNPKIYGRGISMFHLFSNFFYSASPYVLRHNCYWKNKRTSPALTLNFHQLLDSSSELFPDLDSAKFIEWWVSYYKAMEANYAEENADHIIPGTDQAPCLTKSSIDNRSCNESRRKMNTSCEASSHDNDQSNVQQDNWHEEESEKYPHRIFITTKHGDDDRMSPQESQEASSQNCLVGNELEESDEFQKKMLFKKITEGRKRGDVFEINRNGNQVKKEDLSSKDLPSNSEGKKTDAKKELEEMFTAILCWVDPSFEISIETKENTLRESKLKDSKDQQLQENDSFGIDFVPAFRCQGWPQVAQEWIKRERKWPSPDVIANIIPEGFHLVVKPPKNGGNPDCDFRISFSRAEYLLVEQMNDIQRECYLCLKKYHRAYLSKEPKGLVSFHLKNLLFQTIEETGTEMWTEDNRAECMMKLLRKLLEALRKKHLPHFFVRSYNLFCTDYIEGPAILESLAKKVDEIVENPLKFARGMIQTPECNSTKHTERRERVPSNDTIASVSEKSVTVGEDHGELEENHSTQREQNPIFDFFSKINLHHNSAIPGYGYHDLKEMYLATCQLLIDTAFNNADCSLENFDPMERTAIVKDLREIGRDRIITIDEFDETFDLAYFMALMRNEPNIRRRLLQGIQTVVEVWKLNWKLKEDFKSESEGDLYRKSLIFLAKVPFVLHQMFLIGSKMELPFSFVNSLVPIPARSREADVDDIPLD